MNIQVDVSFLSFSQFLSVFNTLYFRFRLITCAHLLTGVHVVITFRQNENELA
jgi:hypothetical protein